VYVDADVDVIKSKRENTTSRRLRYPDRRPLSHLFAVHTHPDTCSTMHAWALAGQDQTRREARPDPAGQPQASYPLTSVALLERTLRNDEPGMCAFRS